VPIGHAVNANIAMVTGFSVHPDAEEAKRCAAACKSRPPEGVIGVQK